MCDKMLICIVPIYNSYLRQNKKYNINKYWVLYLKGGNLSLYGMVYCMEKCPAYLSVIVF